MINICTHTITSAQAPTSSPLSSLYSGLHSAQQLLGRALEVKVSLCDAHKANDLSQLVEEAMLE
jgi:hypothetical protein